MRSRILGFIALCVALLALTATAGAADLPYDSNAECFECHGVLAGGGAFESADFGAAAVDYARCNACHAEPPHYDTGDQCNMCHLPWPTRTVFYDGSHILAGGFYDTPTSLETDPATLHEIHVNGSWLKGILVYSGCDDCHQNAACSACHGDSPQHGDHALDTYPATEYTDCNGSSSGEHSVTCVDAACHALATAGSVQFDAPLCTGCHAAQHDDQDAAHDSGAVTCGGSGCHEVNDVSVTHGASDEEPLAGCERCHAPTVTPATADCATCHPSEADAHHEIHNAATVIQFGCSRCHDPYLDDEHADAGLTCGACHDSTDPLVQSAIATGDKHCDTCHLDRHYLRRGR